MKRQATWKLVASFPLVLSILHTVMAKSMSMPPTKFTHKMAFNLGSDYIQLSKVSILSVILSKLGLFDTFA